MDQKPAILCRAVQDPRRAPSSNRQSSGLSRCTAALESSDLFSITLYRRPHMLVVYHSLELCRNSHEIQAKGHKPIPLPRCFLPQLIWTGGAKQIRTFVYCRGRGRDVKGTHTHICMYICICIQNVYTYIQAFIHVYIYIHADVYTGVCMYVSTRISIGFHKAQ